MSLPMQFPFRRHIVAFASVFALLSSSGLALAAPRAAHRDASPPSATAPARVIDQVDHSAWLYRGSDIPPDAGWQFGTLQNGLRFAVRRNGVPPGQVTIRLRVDAGALMEQPGESGWAHLIEHLSFRESTYLTNGEARRAWQRLGVSFGSDTNASTGMTQTIYQLDIPAATPEAVQQSIRYLSGMIRNPVLTDATVNAERPIVLAEMRERDGAGFRQDMVSRQHFFAGQLLGERSSIGTEQTLGAANGAGIKAFHDRWYRPERVVIAIAGDMDPTLFERAIVDNFASWRPTGPAGVDPDFGRPDPQFPVGRVHVEPTQPMVLNYATIRPWHRVTDSVEYSQGLMMQTLAAFIINRRLEERARAGGRYLGAQMDNAKPNRSADITSISIIPINGDWAGALEDVRAVVEAAKQTPPSQADIDREFANVESFLATQLANAQNEPGTKQADDLLQAVDIGETVTSPDHQLDIWRAVRPIATPQRILQITRDLLSGPVQRALLVSPTPVDGGDVALAQAISGAPVRQARNTARSGRRHTAADLPRIGPRGTLRSREPVDRFGMERWEFANGVTVLVRNIPIEPDKIRINVRWGGGRHAVSPTGPNLLWAGPPALVESGLRRLDQTALDEISNGRQIGMRFAIADDAFEFSAETRQADLADQLRLLAAKFVAPGWNPRPVERARAGQLIGYDLLSSSPAAVIENGLKSALYSGDRRFGPPTREEVSALTPAAFRAFWEPLLRNGPLEIQVFGDVGSLDLEGMLASSFGALPRRTPINAPAGANELHITPVPASPIVVRHNGSEGQAAAILAYPTGGGIADTRTSRQLDILAAIYNDRLYDRLRDQAGASYSQAVSSVWPKDFASGGYLFVGGLVRPQDTELMYRSARAIAAEMVSAPVTEDELRRAVGPAVEQIERAASGNVFWMLETEGATRDPDRFRVLRRYLTDLASVTPADIQRLAGIYLQPGRAVPVLILPEDQPAATTAAAGPAR